MDYPITAQSKKSSNKDITLLNKEIYWQLDNKIRGLCFKAINFSKAKLFIFLDRSFANIKDQSFQIGFIIIIVNKYLYANISKFTIKGDIIYWSLTKCQCVTQDILASEIYGIVNGFD